MVTVVRVFWVVRVVWLIRVVRLLMVVRVVRLCNFFIGVPAKFWWFGLLGLFGTFGW